MNKAFLQQLFCKTTGHVYKFLGTVPSDANETEHITVQFVTAAGDNQLSTVVVVLPESHSTLIYVDSAAAIEAPDFVLITDLLPDPVVEEIIDEVVAETTPPQEG